MQIQPIRSATPSASDRSRSGSIGSRAPETSSRRGRHALDACGPPSASISTSSPCQGRSRPKKSTVRRERRRSAVGTSLFGSTGWGTTQTDLPETPTSRAAAAAVLGGRDNAIAGCRKRHANASTAPARLVALVRGFGFRGDITAWKKPRTRRAPLSGAINESESPRNCPRFEKSAPLDTPVTDSAALFLHLPISSVRFPSLRPRSQHGKLRVALRNS